MESWDSYLRQRKYKKSDRGIQSGKSFTSNKRYSNGYLPNFIGYGIILILLVSLKIFVIFENYFPDQILLKEAKVHSGRFIGERAELQLKRLTDLGTRVVGSYENEVLAVDWLKREISFIQQEANSKYTIEVDVQKPTGSYYLFLKPYGFRNYYANIQNVVVKLSSSKKSNSILLNCHYDTVPESPGASDNGINCIVMLEILRVLSTEKVPLKNNVIFLFNGAEENPLQASHGFLSQHKWRKDVKVVINLDSAGAGGKEILFQTSGEAWLMDIFSKSVPRPTGGVQAEELFQFGVIPSDTDFRIFRDFGNYPGFDIAHATNGYIYHTKYDKMDYIQPGVYQHTGDNILALVKALANSSELEKEHLKTKIVYFDVFNLFMVVYTEHSAFLINLITVILSMYAVSKTLNTLPDYNESYIKRLSVPTGGQLLALLLSSAVIFFISKTLDIYKSTMSWYSRPWLIIPLYAFPTILTMISILLLVQTRMRKDLPTLDVIRFINGAQLLWTMVLFVGTLKGLRTTFIIMLIVLLPSLGSLFVTISKKLFSVKVYLITYMTCLIFPALFTIHQCVRIFQTIIPMTARMGPHTNSEIIIGALTFIMSMVYLSQIVPLFLLLRKPKTFLITLCAIHILAIVGVVGTKYGFPYNGDLESPAFQRFYVLHSERTFFDAKGAIRGKDSGIFIQPLDRNSINYVSEFIPELKGARSASNDCQTELFCAFPTFTSRFIKPARYSYWIPSDPPTIHHPTSLEVVNQTQISVHVRRVRILITGPDHITIGISPQKNIKLLKWSFDEFIPQESEDWNERKTYMVYYSHGLMGGTLEFDIDLEISQSQKNFLMNIAVIGHYMHDKKFRTDHFKKLLSRFPDWAHTTPWTTTYKSWII